MMYLIELMNARHMSRTDLSDLSGCLLYTSPSPRD